MASSHHASARRIEQRSLRFGDGANAVMTMAGFLAHVLNGSSALLLDGLYSSVLVGSSLIASRISSNLVRPPDRAWPYGYEGQEALYVLFRSLVLLGVIGFGLSSSLGILIDWWRGAEIAPLTLEPVASQPVVAIHTSGGHGIDHRRASCVAGQCCAAEGTASGIAACSARGRCECRNFLVSHSR